MPSIRLTKEVIYLAVSVTNSRYCIRSYAQTATELGLSKQTFGGFIPVIANGRVKTNPLANGDRFAVDCYDVGTVK
ncbi:MAG: carboxymuconolactone decarboxylase family protein [Verrucomicrobia bacterium]|nr:carboxymuconolactone decarboxylase family protein [Verrucomicrobiota bacterium]